MDTHQYPFLSPFQILTPSSLRPVCMIRPLQLTMIPAQVQCRGCDKTFTPHGLSQHISKTLNLRCRYVNDPPRAHFGIPSIPYAASQASPSPIHMPESITDERTGDQYYQTTSDHKNNGPNLSENSSSGAFFVTGVSD